MYLLSPPEPIDAGLSRDDWRLMEERFEDAPVPSKVAINYEKANYRKQLLL